MTMFYELAQLAIGNLSRARARLVMTAGGVLVGTTAVIILIALTIGLQQAAEAGIGASGSLTEIQVWPNWNIPRGQSQEDLPQLNVDAVRALWQLDGVIAVVPMVRLQAAQLIADDYMGGGDFLGIDPALLPYLGVTPAQGSLSLGEGQLVAGAHVSEQFYDPEASGDTYEPIVVDLMSVEKLRLNLFQWSGEAQAERKITMQTSAVLQEGTNYDYSVLLPIRDVMAWNEWSTGQKPDPDTFTYDQIIVRTANREVTTAVADAVRELGYQPGGIADFINQLNQFFGTMRLLLGGVGGVALLVAAFGVANTMTMAILERTKEIGLMKAIGATDRDVLTVFLIEAGLVGLCGGISGVGVALFLQNLVNGALKNAPQGQQGGAMFLPIDPATLQGNLIVIPTELATFAIVLATCVGLGAGLLPAFRAAKLPPVIALKSE
jgi:putative ABC transport system permease protein